MLYGQYFDGRFLAVMLMLHENYRQVFAPLVADTELQRLAAYSIHRAGDGPFVASSTALVLVSNLAWAGELLAAALLVVRRLWGAWFAVGLILAIELAARELVFGIVMIALFLLSTPLRVATPAYRVLLVATCLLTCVGLDWLPGKQALFGFEVW